MRCAARSAAAEMPKSHGTGEFTRDQFRSLGRGVVLEAGVLVFHPENIELGDDVYVGHQTILKGYFRQQMVVGAGSWIGQQCFLHAAGGLAIGRNVGIGPAVKILTSTHRLDELAMPILHSTVDFAAVTIGDGADLGVGAVILPGVCIGANVQVGAGAVVTADVPDDAIVAGVPARLVRMRR
jgi:acetyltransferase-like isoleucine patch superfamily enzyme